MVSRILIVFLASFGIFLAPASAGTEPRLFIQRPGTIRLFRDEKHVPVKPLLINKQAFVTKEDASLIWGVSPNAPVLRVGNRSYFNLRETAESFEYLVEWVPARKTINLVKILLDPSRFDVTPDSKDPNLASLLFQGKVAAWIQGDASGASARERATLIASRLNAMHLPSLKLEDISIIRQSGVYEVWIFGEKKLPLDGDDGVRKLKQK